MIILIKDKNHHREIINILNNNNTTNENSIPRINNIPIKTEFARCFILENNVIEERKKKMLKENMDTSRFVLTNNNCVFKLDVMHFNRVFTISIPRFELN